MKIFTDEFQELIDELRIERIKIKGVDGAVKELQNIAPKISGVFKGEKQFMGILALSDSLTALIELLDL